MLHAKHADRVDLGNMIIRANDVDIFVILAFNVSVLHTSHLWYDAGLDGDNSRTYVDITKLSDALDYNDMHYPEYAFTWCGYTPFFFRKGKVAPMTLIAKYRKFKDVFMSLGVHALTTEIYNSGRVYLLDVWVSAAQASE